MPQGYYPNQHQQPQYHYQANHPGGQPIQMNPNQMYQHVEQNAGYPNQAYHQQPIVQAHTGQLNQINHGQVYQGQVNAGQLNQGQIPTGQINQAQIQPGQLNSRQLNPGQLNQGQINTQYQQANAQYQPPVNTGNLNTNQIGNQQYQQQNVNAIPVAAAQNTANVPSQQNAQYEQPKMPESNLNQINANVKVDAKH